MAIVYMSTKGHVTSEVDNKPECGKFPMQLQCDTVALTNTQAIPADGELIWVGSFNKKKRTQAPLQKTSDNKKAKVEVQSSEL